MTVPTDPIYTQLPIVSLYDPGHHLPAKAATALHALTFAAITGPMDSATGTVTVSTASAGDNAHGVVTITVDKGGLTGLARGSGRVVRIGVGDSALTAGQDIEVADGGLAAPHDSGTAVGYAIDNADANTIGKVSLY